MVERAKCAPRGRRTASGPRAGPVRLLEARASDSGGDERDAALRDAPLVVVAVAVEGEHVLGMAGAEAQQRRQQAGVAGMPAGRQSRPVSEGHDEPDRGIGLSCVHQGANPGGPVGPRGAGEGLGVRDESHAAAVEPVPILAAAAGDRRSGRGLGIRQVETTLVVPEVVPRAIPFMIAPGRHVGRLQGPIHDVVEVVVHSRLPVRVAVGQVADAQHEGRRAAGDQRLDRADA